MITEGHITRHYQGRRGGRGPAIIDVAQDHLLHRLAQRGVFDLGVSLKGGTAVRKFRAGNAGRFSTDLDFAGLDDSSAELLLEEVRGASVGPFRFDVEEIDGTKRVLLLISSPFGESGVPARLDLGRRSLMLPPETLRFLPLPIHATYDFALPAIPTARAEEVIAEKLARFRRASLARDLYDLAWFSGRLFDESTVRELTLLKVWGDVIDDQLGARPFDPEDVLRPRPADEFDHESIGLLTTPVDVDAWVERVRTRFTFLREMDDTQRALARCDRGDRGLFLGRIAALGGE